MSAPTMPPGQPAPPERQPDVWKVLLSLLPKIPLMVRTTLMHVLRLSEPSKYVDLRTELCVAVLRDYMAPEHQMSITQSQRILNRDAGIKGPIWVSKYTAPVPPPPETGLRDAIARAIDGLRNSLTQNAQVRLPDVAPVEAEWTGHRPFAASDARLPDIPEADKYIEMQKECTSPATVIYFHGGGYFLMDPATHRQHAVKLAKLTGGRCYSVRYRLAPQNPFPAALMDALVSYLALLYPPPGAFHEAVRPEHIVLAGDSAGGHLAACLLQTILELRRQGAKVTWFGVERELPLPAAVTLVSPWMDITHSSPSCETMGAFDILTARKHGVESDSRPACAAWPAVPPRRALFADDDLVLHPLVSLLLAPSWAGAPPVWLCTGWELLTDEDRYAAARIHADGVPIVFEQYEGAPHCFALMFDHSEGAKRCWDSWTSFIRRAAERPAALSTSSFTTVKAKTLREVPIDPDTELPPYTEEELKGWMLKG